MAYERLNLKDGDTLTAAHMAHIEEGVAMALTAVKTEAEMDAILANATDDTVGTFYMFIGATTSKYENGAVYEIEAT